MNKLVKICGIKTPQALKTAMDNKADFIGLVFFEPSPRNVSIAEAKELADQARNELKIVALTVDASDDLIDKIATKVRPDYIQAHGNETPERITAIKAATGLPIIKAIKVRDAADVSLAEPFIGLADIILYDAKAPDNSPDALPGGNGIGFDWSLLKTTKSDNGPPKNFMLSGGLDPSNIAAAVATTDATIFDVSSGVESAPGEKDHAAIKNFIVAMRNAG